MLEYWLFTNFLISVGLNERSTMEVILKLEWKGLEIKEHWSYNEAISYKAANRIHF